MSRANAGKGRSIGEDRLDFVGDDLDHELKRNVSYIPSHFPNGTYRPAADSHVRSKPKLRPYQSESDMDRYFTDDGGAPRKHRDYGGAPGRTNDAHRRSERRYQSQGDIGIDFDARDDGGPPAAGHSRSSGADRAHAVRDAPAPAPPGGGRDGHHRTGRSSPAAIDTDIRAAAAAPATSPLPRAGGARHGADADNRLLQHDEDDRRHAADNGGRRMGNRLRQYHSEANLARHFDDHDSRRSSGVLPRSSEAGAPNLQHAAPDAAAAAATSPGGADRYGADADGRGASSRHRHANPPREQGPSSPLRSPHPRRDPADETAARPGPPDDRRRPARASEADLGRYIRPDGHRPNAAAGGALRPSGSDSESGPASPAAPEDPAELAPGRAGSPPRRRVRAPEAAPRGRGAGRGGRPGGGGQWAAWAGGGGRPQGQDAG